MVKDEAAMVLLSVQHAAPFPMGHSSWWSLAKAGEGGSSRSSWSRVRQAWRLSVLIQQSISTLP